MTEELDWFLRVLFPVKDPERAVNERYEVLEDLKMEMTQGSSHPMEKINGDIVQGASFTIGFKTIEEAIEGLNKCKDYFKKNGYDDAYYILARTYSLIPFPIPDEILEEK